MNLAQKIVDKIPTSILLPAVFSAGMGAIDHLGHSHLLDTPEAKMPLAEAPIGEIAEQAKVWMACLHDDLLGADEGERPVPEGLDCQGKNAFWVFMISFGVLFPFYGLRSNPNTMLAQDVWQKLRGSYRVTGTGEDGEKSTSRFWAEESAEQCDNEIKKTTGEPQSHTEQWRWNKGWTKTQWI